MRIRSYPLFKNCLGHPVRWMTCTASLPLRRALCVALMRMANDSSLEATQRNSYHNCMDVTLRVPDEEGWTIGGSHRTVHFMYRVMLVGKCELGASGGGGCVAISLPFHQWGGPFGH